jgi:hypothetical protein
MARFTITICGKGIRIETLKRLLEKYNPMIIKYDDQMSRAERLSEAENLMQQALSIVEELKDEMQNWYDSMPENLQSSDKGSQVEEATHALEELYGCIEQCDFSSVEFPGMY